jgi:uncharacterized protein YnzC (UPF0291/DUF896 family)
MIRSKILEEIHRVDELLAQNADKKEGTLTSAEVKQLASERKKLEKYRKELLREWQHINH